MKDIAQLYHNGFGVAFYWKKEDNTLKERIQLVFRETGFFLTPAQIKEFSQLINKCKGMQCHGCSMKGHCHKFLLKTPVPEIDLAVNYNEYMEIKDLVEGTLFTLRLHEYVYNISCN